MTNDDILTRIEELKTVIADQVVRFEVGKRWARVRILQDCLVLLRRLYLPQPKGRYSPKGVLLEAIRTAALVIRVELFKAIQTPLLSAQRSIPMTQLRTVSQLRFCPTGGFPINRALGNLVKYLSAAEDTAPSAPILRSSRRTTWRATAV
jgi:hypothetical protein